MEDAFQQDKIFRLQTGRKTLSLHYVEMNCREARFGAKADVVLRHKTSIQTLKSGSVVARPSVIPVGS